MCVSTFCVTVKEASKVVHTITWEAITVERRLSHKLDAEVGFNGREGCWSSETTVGSVVGAWLVACRTVRCAPSACGLKAPGARRCAQLVGTLGLFVGFSGSLLEREVRALLAFGMVGDHGCHQRSTSVLGGVVRQMPHAVLA